MGIKSVEKKKKARRGSCWGDMVVPQQRLCATGPAVEHSRRRLRIVDCASIAVKIELTKKGFGLSLKKLELRVL